MRVSPSPSWPSSLRPQMYATPVFEMATECVAMAPAMIVWIGMPCSGASLGDGARWAREV